MKRVLCLVLLMLCMTSAAAERHVNAADYSKFDAFLDACEMGTTVELDTLWENPLLGARGGDRVPVLMWIGFPGGDTGVVYVDEKEFIDAFRDGEPVHIVGTVYSFGNTGRHRYIEKITVERRATQRLDVTQLDGPETDSALKKMLVGDTVCGKNMHVKKTGYGNDGSTATVVAGGYIHIVIATKGKCAYVGDVIDFEGTFSRYDSKKKIAFLTSRDDQVQLSK